MPTLQRLWYSFCALALLFFLTSLVVIIPFQDLLSKSKIAVICVRAFPLCIDAALIFVLINMSIYYFKYVLEMRATIRRQNILFFYVVSVILFALMCRQLWLLFPSTFSYPEPPFQYQSDIIINGSPVIKLTLDFVLFSALSTVGANYFALQTNSALSAFLTWLQGIYTLSLIALLIASYVNQKVGLAFTEPKSKKEKQSSQNSKDSN